MHKPYNWRNCQSLFGYALKVHKRSGGICQLCEYGSEGELDFNLWRQLTVEHVISKSKGGEFSNICKAIRERFPDLSKEAAENYATIIDENNTVTACSFCNSATSRHKDPVNMTNLILSSPSDPDDMLSIVLSEVERVLQNKISQVKWKLESIKSVFSEVIEGQLVEVRLRRNTT